LEEQLVWLVIAAMERSEQEANNSASSGNDGKNSNDEIPNSTHWLWLHLSSQLIYFVLFQFANFPNIVMALHDKVIFRLLHVFLLLINNN